MIKWKVKFKQNALKSLSKLDIQTKKCVLNYLDERIIGEKNPRRFGKALSGQMKGLWRYRIMNIRLIVNIEDDEYIVLVLEVGKRDNIYK